MDINDAVIREGAARFALESAAMSKIERGGAPDGVVYDYKGELIVKFVPIKPDALPQLHAKLAFIRYLSDNGVQVPAPLPSSQGCTVEVIEDDAESWAMTVVRKAPGRHLPPEEWDETFFRAWGRTMGQMHALSAKYHDGREIQHWRDEHQYFTSICQDNAILERWVWIKTQLEQLPEEPGAFGLIHNDLHAWNLLVDGQPDTPGAITVLDFDVCTHHWFMTDIAIALFHPIWENRERPAEERDAFARRFKQAWLSGYAQAYTLSDTWLARLPLFARYRQLLFYLAMRGEYGANEKAQPFLNALRQNILDDAPIPSLEA